MEERGTYSVSSNDIERVGEFVPINNDILETMSCLVAYINNDIDKSEAYSELSELHLHEDCETFLLKAEDILNDIELLIETGNSDNIYNILNLKYDICFG